MVLTRTSLAHGITQTCRLGMKETYAILIAIYSLRHSVSYTTVLELSMLSQCSCIASALTHRDRNVGVVDAPCGDTVRRTQASEVCIHGCTK